MIAYLVDRYPELTQTFVAGEVEEMRALGHEVRVEAAVPGTGRGGASYGSDDARIDRLRALAWLLARHPGACARDVWSQRRWRREEAVRPLRRLAPVARRVQGARHLHAHFATGAALDAMRLSALLGVPYSVMTHGYDIFQSPANLCEKLTRAKFAATPCEYSARHLRERCPGAPVEKLVMGVDVERFRRDRPHTTERTVVAVGRLVEKKGFRYLAEAAPLIDARVVVVGDGPVRLQGVELLGALPPERAREVMQDAAVLAVPCVVAADGDRDTMPMVVKEALALEVPVVASNEVGLPEIVRPEWGRLVPPHDVRALAAALTELLDMTPQQRGQMGAAGRAFIIERCSRRKETARLAELIG